jgi:hypothetical protein
VAVHNEVGMQVNNAIGENQERAIGKHQERAIEHEEHPLTLAPRATSCPTLLTPRAGCSDAGKEASRGSRIQRPTL